MPFALLIIGGLLLIAAVRGKVDGPDGLFALVQSDFTGPQNFLYWMVAIMVIGALGYIPKIKPISIAMLTLVVLVLFLVKGDPARAGGGFFEKFTAGLASTQSATGTAAAGPTQNSLTSSIGSLGQYTLQGLSAIPSISDLVH